MPDLGTMFDLIQSRSYFSRPDAEVWAVINTCSRYAYQAALKEDRLFWLVTDTTSVALVANQTEYALPQACQQIVRVRERLNSTDEWRVVESDDIRSDTMERSTPLIGNMVLDDMSQFTFSGPYLTNTVATDGNDDQTYSIQFAPVPQESRQVELLYVAKYVEVWDEGDAYIIPDDLRDVVMDLAVAELIRGNNDSLAADYTQAGMAKLSMALTAIRDKQVEHLPSVEPYLSEFL